MSGLRRVVLLIAMGLCLPGAARASLVWDIAVSGPNLSGAGQITFSGPDSGVSPDFTYAFSGQTFSHSWTATEDDVSSALWFVDAQGDLQRFELVQLAVPTDTTGVSSEFEEIFDAILFNRATSICRDALALSRCGGADFAIAEGALVLTPVHDLPEPGTLLLLLPGLALAVAFGLRSRPGRPMPNLATA